jgi:hypothetical protein
MPLAEILVAIAGTIPEANIAVGYMMLCICQLSRAHAFKSVSLVFH